MLNMVVHKVTTGPSANKETSADSNIWNKYETTDWWRKLSNQRGSHVWDT